MGVPSRASPSARAGLGGQPQAGSADLARGGAAGPAAQAQAPAARGVDRPGRASARRAAQPRVGVRLPVRPVASCKTCSMPFGTNPPRKCRSWRPLGQGAALLATNRSNFSDNCRSRPWISGFEYAPSSPIPKPRKRSALNAMHRGYSGDSWVQEPLAGRSRPSVVTRDSRAVAARSALASPGGRVPAATPPALAQQPARRTPNARPRAHARRTRAAAG